MQQSGLIFAELASVPAGIILAYTGTIGISGALIFTTGATQGARIGRICALKLIPSTLAGGNLHKIAVLALGVFTAIAAGWSTANSFGFPISFSASALALFGGMMLLGVSVLTTAFLDDL